MVECLEREVRETEENWLWRHQIQGHRAFHLDCGTLYLLESQCLYVLNGKRSGPMSMDSCVRDGIFNSCLETTFYSYYY